MSLLERLKLLLTIEGDLQDALLLLFLEQAQYKIFSKLYPYGTPTKLDADGNSIDPTVPKHYEYLQLNIAVYLYNKQGAEGQTSHTENGIGRSYESADVPESMLRDITPFVGVM